MKIAAQLYTVNQYLKTKEDMESTFKKIKDMGYDYIQLSGAGNMDDEKAQYIKELKDKYELDICVTHMSFEQLTDELDQLIQYHKLWNCQYIGLGSMPVDMRQEEGYYAFIKIANEIGKKVAEAGMTFVYHNHRFEFEKFNGKTGMDILLEGFNEHVQFLLDTYWVQAGGASPVKWIEKLANRLDIVHFKDMGIKDNTEFFAEIGAGNLDWYDIIEACKKSGVQYAAVERDSGETDPFTSLDLSLNYLRNVHQL